MKGKKTNAQTTILIKMPGGTIAVIAYGEIRVVRLGGNWQKGFAEGCSMIQNSHTGS